LKLLNHFTCDPSTNTTCHACTTNSRGVERCTCYDCERGSGQCTKAYNCTGTYGGR
jgi:hypothetical protein